MFFLYLFSALGPHLMENLEKLFAVLISVQVILHCFYFIVFFKALKWRLVIFLRADYQKITFVTAPKVMLKIRDREAW